MQLTSYKPAGFGHVAVLMGGVSAEREISLESGQAVFDALVKKEVETSLIDFKPNQFHLLQENNFDRVFIALHGRGGEDGTIQGALETIGLPYSGSGVIGSALAMDKVRSKAIWQQANLSTPFAVELNQSSDWQAVGERLSFPLMVKPVREGSSIGATKVNAIEELEPAWQKANSHDPRVMAEKWIEGDEYTVPILNNQVLPMIKLETKREFYNYEAKYEDEDTKYICPCGLDGNREKDLGEIALAACQQLDVSGWARVDMMVDANQQAWLIEVNTVPGMTSHSLVPMSAKQAGIEFEELVLQILASSFANDSEAGRL